MTAKIDFIDLAAQQARIRPQLDAAIKRVLDGGAYIMGKEVGVLEKQLADFAGVKHCLSCSSGTDALVLVLMAKGVKAGDAVFVPSFTFAASAEVVALLGATPIFVDCLPDTFNMCPKSLIQAIAMAKKMGLNSACVMPVDLFGQPADYDKILPIAEENGLFLLCDAAQGFGGVYKGKKVGSIGLATATSFFPAKPLGCYGDGGAVFTDDDELYEILVSLRVHGKGDDKYDNVRVGMNGRLDTIQAAILIEKLAIFADELVERQRVADRYGSQLNNLFATPFVPTGLSSAWAQYTIIADSTAQREHLQTALKQCGVPSMIYYPKPLHQQTAYKNYPTATGGALPVCENLAGRVFSLPMHPYLEDESIDYIAKSLLNADKQAA
ncbi:MAG: DegT/DnrJ/EryC1/StrS family aminotransferase [Alphaproteobacteria bacterium]|nr:DegT/DnrJ/EryC1/StrS family aminotransferase [Alphaproteobacteria bacterium]